MRRTKATLIYRRTKNLRAVHWLLEHSKLESTVRYLGIEVDDALDISGKEEAARPLEPVLDHVPDHRTRRGGESTIILANLKATAIERGPPTQTIGPVITLPNRSRAPGSHPEHPCEPQARG